MSIRQNTSTAVERIGAVDAWLGGASRSVYYQCPGAYYGDRATRAFNRCILGAHALRGVSMAWQIHYLDRDDHQRELSVPLVGEAVAVATRLQREGLLVETIQADTGLKLTSRDVRVLCDASEFRFGTERAGVPRA
jgi:hypothetical protein